MISPRAPASNGVILTLLGLVQFLLLLSINPPVVAAPTVARELGMPFSTAQFVVAAYALAWGALLLLGGRTSDLVGRRRVLVAGLWVFIAGLVAAGVAWTGAVVIAARAIQGLGAAIGVVASGLLTDVSGWRATFTVTLVVAIRWPCSPHGCCRRRPRRPTQAGWTRGVRPPSPSV